MLKDSASKIALGAVAAIAVLSGGCSKGGSSGSAQASPAATMVYSGSTDTGGGGPAPTMAAVEQTTGKVVAGDPAHGKVIFTQNCSACHGADGTQGGVGPSLKGEKARKDMAATVAWIKIPPPPMPKLYPSPLDEKAVADVAAYVQSL